MCRFKLTILSLCTWSILAVFIIPNILFSANVKQIAEGTRVEDECSDLILEVARKNNDQKILQECEEKFKNERKLQWKDEVGNLHSCLVLSECTSLQLERFREAGVRGQAAECRSSGCVPFDSTYAKNKVFSVGDALDLNYADKLSSLRSDKSEFYSPEQISQALSEIGIVPNESKLSDNESISPLTQALRDSSPMSADTVSRKISKGTPEDTPNLSSKVTRLEPVKKESTFSESHRQPNSESSQASEGSEPKSTVGKIWEGLTSGAATGIDAAQKWCYMGGICSEKALTPQQLAEIEAGEIPGINTIAQGKVLFSRSVDLIGNIVKEDIPRMFGLGPTEPVDDFVGFVGDEISLPVGLVDDFVVQTGNEISSFDVSGYTGADDVGGLHAANNPLDDFIGADFTPPDYISNLGVSEDEFESSEGFVYSPQVLKQALNTFDELDPENPVRENIFNAYVDTVLDPATRSLVPSKELASIHNQMSIDHPKWNQVFEAYNDAVFREFEDRQSALAMDREIAESHPGFIPDNEAEFLVSVRDRILTNEERAVFIQSQLEAFNKEQELQRTILGNSNTSDNILSVAERTAKDTYMSATHIGDCEECARWSNDSIISQNEACPQGNCGNSTKEAYEGLQNLARAYQEETGVKPKINEGSYANKEDYFASRSDQGRPAARDGGDLARGSGFEFSCLDQADCVRIARIASQSGFNAIGAGCLRSGQCVVHAGVRDTSDRKIWIENSASNELVNTLYAHKNGTLVASVPLPERGPADVVSHNTISISPSFQQIYKVGPQNVGAFRIALNALSGRCNPTNFNSILQYASCIAGF
jgi:hypothetical protein